jgi:hypothetical protein
MIDRASDGRNTPVAAPMRGRIIARRAVRVLALIPLALVILWATAAIWIDGPSVRWLAAILAIALPVLFCAMFRIVRRFWLAALLNLGLFAAVLAWWLTIAPRNDRDWQPDVAKLAFAEFAGNSVTIHNVRNFTYRSNDDFDENWETRAYDLSRIVGFDLFISFWGPTLIAHTIASWEFADGRHLAISVETRKEKGEEYSAIRGFFRRFEIYYVIADERDLIGLRAIHRGERVHLYRMHTPPAEARDLLIECLQTVNHLANQPEWYNALTANCTSSIRYHFKQVAGIRAYNWRFLLNGYLDELLYDRGQIDTSLSLADLRLRSNITQRAKDAGDDPAFSHRIREQPPQ